MRTMAFTAALAACMLAPLAANAEIDAVAGMMKSAGNAAYIPLSGSSVTVKQCAVSANGVPYPDAFPDITSRFALATLSTAANVSYGPVSGAAKNTQYRATSDYVNTDTVPVTVWIEELHADDPAGPGYDVQIGDPKDGKHSQYVVPVLIGVGFRVTAEFVAVDAKAELTGMGVIGANASASKLRGSLMVEALGASGKAIATSIPIASKLDQTTVENAILAVGAGRAFMYGDQSKDTYIVPRVVGMFSPGNHAHLVNAIYSEIMAKGVDWQRPCKA